MKRHLFASALPLAAITATLIAVPARAQPDSTAPPARSPGSTPAEKVVKQGFLFSAISFADSAFGVEWSRLRAEAQTKLPGLKLTAPEDLHITVEDFLEAQQAPAPAR